MAFPFLSTGALESAALAIPYKSSGIALQEAAPQEVTAANPLSSTPPGQGVQSERRTGDEQQAHGHVQKTQSGPIFPAAVSAPNLLERVFEQLRRERIVRVKVEAFDLDSTSVKAHPDGAGALKKRPAIHRQVPGGMEHRDSYGCRGCSNGGRVHALSRQRPRRPGRPRAPERPGSARRLIRELDMRGLNPHKRLQTVSACGQIRKWARTAQAMSWVRHKRSEKK